MENNPTNDLPQQAASQQQTYQQQGQIDSQLLESQFQSMQLSSTPHSASNQQQQSLHMNIMSPPQPQISSNIESLTNVMSSPQNLQQQNMAQLQTPSMPPPKMTDLSQQHQNNQVGTQNQMNSQQQDSFHGSFSSSFINRPENMNFNSLSNPQQQHNDTPNFIDQPAFRSVSTANMSMQGRSNFFNNPNMYSSQQTNSEYPSFGSIIRSGPSYQQNYQLQGRSSQEMQDPNFGPVLRVVVDNFLFNVPLQQFREVFGSSSVLRIVTFWKSNQYQALIELTSAEVAAAAKERLQGTYLNRGCNIMRIEFSRLKKLRISWNNEKSQDYTRPDLPRGQSFILNSSNSMSRFNSGGTTHTTPSPAAMYQLSTISNNSPPVVNMGMVPNHPQQASVHFGITSRNPTAITNSPVNYSPQQVNATQTLPSLVLHVSNLDECAVTPSVLFILFGVFGDVNRVKIIFKKRNTALVQMNTSDQAVLAKRYLHGVRFLGKQLQIAHSHYREVQMPKEGQDTENLTHDYTNSQMHRFKVPGSKNYGNIHPPSSVLHLSNIPEGITEEKITSAFNAHRPVKNFKFFAKEKKMALVQLETVEDAIYCLVKMHLYKISDSHDLRVSFSRGHIL